MWTDMFKKNYQWEGGGIHVSIWQINWLRTQLRKTNYFDHGYTWQIIAILHLAPCREITGVFNLK